MAQTTTAINSQATPLTDDSVPVGSTPDTKNNLGTGFFQSALTWDEMTPEEQYFAIKDSKLRATAAPFRPGAPGHYCKFRPNPKATPFVPAAQKARDPLVVDGSSAWINCKAQKEDSSSARSSSPPTSENA